MGLSSQGTVRTTRERTSVKYEIDHAGTVLIVRMYPTHDGHGEATWKIEATLADGSTNDAPVSAAAATRGAALDAVARAWFDARMARPLPAVDWKAIASLLRASHAL